VAVGAVLVLWGLLYVVAGSGIARGTTVAGVDIGGRSAPQARALLQQRLGPRASADIKVRVGDVTRTVSPKRAGLAFDIPATVDAAKTRSWNPIALLDALAGGDDVAPVVTVDQAALADTVDALAARIDRPVQEGGVTFRNTTVVSTQPRQGRAVRRPAAARLLRTAYVRETGVIELPARVREPQVTAEEVRRAARELGKPAVSAPVTLVVDGKQTSISAAAIGRSLSLAPDAAHHLKPSVDGAKLHAQIADDLAPDIETPAKDATFRIVRNKPRVVPSASGRAVSAADLAAAVLPVLTKTGDGRRATASLSVSEPALTTQKATTLGVDELVTEYTTFYPSDFAPRLTNIHRAAELMDDTVVLPRAVFSLNGTVGERTAERGFAAGFIIDDGKLEVDFGGGVSQLATTTFNAAFFAGLQIVEHHPHSFYISRYPEGRESTVAWGVKDVKVRNDSGHGVFITTAYTDSSVTVRIWGTKRFRIQATKTARYDLKPFKTVFDPRPAGTQPGTCVASEGVPGFKVDVFRVFLQNGKEVDREKFHTVYAPENKVLCDRPSVPSP
jgi:vancomycin resistance protein YoaR